MLKKISFTLITLLLFYVILLALEAVLAWSDVGVETDLFVEDTLHADYLRVNGELGRIFFPGQKIKPHMANDVIRGEKSDSTLRIFVFGGSSAAGWPYYYNGTFARMLHRQLERALPARQVEVVNFGMPAVNSRAVRWLVKKSLRWQPDAILVYAGHNEYYGSLGVASSIRLSPVLTDIYLSLSEWRLFQLAVRLIKGGEQKSTGGKGATLMQRMVGRQKIPYASSLYKAGLDVFYENLKAIASECRSASVPLYVSDLAANLSDQPPFISDGQSPYPAAEWYARGQTLRGQGQHLRARKAFSLARDYDLLRFRAADSLNRLIHARAAALNYHAVSGEKAVALLDTNGYIGDKAMLDHLHPNLEATRKISGAFYRALISSGLIHPADTLFSIPREMLGITALDDAIGRLRINILKAGWPFRQTSRLDSFLAAYKPLSVLDQLAWEYWNGKMSWHDAHYNLSKMYSSRESWQAAAEEYRALLYDVALDARLMVKLAAALLQTGGQKEALRWLKKSTRIQDGFRARAMMGLIYTHRLEFNKAIAQFEAALNFRPADKSTLYNLAGLYRQVGNMDKSREIIERMKKDGSVN